MICIDYLPESKVEDEDEEQSYQEEEYEPHTLARIWNVNILILSISIYFAGKLGFNSVFRFTAKV